MVEILKQRDSQALIFVEDIVFEGNIIGYIKLLLDKQAVTEHHRNFNQNQLFQSLLIIVLSFCAAALATVKTLHETDIICNVEAKGALFESLLSHPSIVAIRRVGLMMAVEFDSPETVQRIVHACLERGVITFWFLSDPVSFRLQPPLTITEDQIREACDILSEAIVDI